VTGATGFAGSHLADLLIARGYPVRVMVRETSDLRWIHPDAEKVVADVRDRSSVGDAVRDVSWVFHFGALIAARSREEFFAVNARGTKALYEVFVEQGSSPELFLFCSSQAAIGPSLNGTPSTEDDAPKPISSYGASKKAAEDFLKTRAGAGSGPRIIIIRPPAVYGPRDAAILKFAKTVSKGWIPLPAPPRAKFGMIHVRDLAEGSLLLAENGHEGIFHLNDGEAHTWEDLGRFVADELHVKARFLRIPPWVSWCAGLGMELMGKLSGRAPLLTREKVRDLRQTWLGSIEKASAVAGFEPKRPVRDGLRETMAWYRENQWV